MSDIETINFVEERYKKTASHYANKYELNTNLPNTPCYVEISDESELFFLDHSISNSFLKGKFASRIQKYQTENLIKKAFGKNISSMSILDCTGGLGHDTFILALLGANVTYVEQNKGLTILFEEALRCLPPTKYFIDAVKRITVRQSDSRAFLEQAEHYDAIYIDPMFNSEKKLARNKTMTFLDMYLDDHGDELFDLFAAVNYKRLVVKKEGRAVSVKKPNLEIKGKSVKFDVYIK